MTITCRDLTNAKLFLVIDFLAFLNRYADKAFIYCSSQNAREYRPLEKLFENVHFKSGKPQSAQISFIDEMDQNSQESLVFPILKNDQIPEERPSSWIPISSSTQFPGYYLPDLISTQDMVQKLVTVQDFKGLRLLISAGPTAEDLDPVRYLTNRSTGKMGISLARAAYIRGADVQLVYGPGQETVPITLQTELVRSADRMAEQVLHHFSDTDVYIGTAAVADYTPVQVASQKIKKSPKGLQLKMKRTSDILRLLSAKKKKQILVGFSVETENVIANSLKKLEQKNLDMIVINNPKEHGSGFAGDTNKVSVLLKNDQMYKLPLQNKYALSHKLLDFILEQVRANV